MSALSSTQWMMDDATVSAYYGKATGSKGIITITLITVINTPINQLINQHVNLG